MKYFLTIFILLFSFGCFSQVRVLTGLEPTTGRAGYIYRDTLRTLNLRSPLYRYNDSTIATNDTISSIAKNAARDSIILTLANGQRFAVKDSAGGGGTPAGTSGQIQYNNGSFGASSNLFWDITNSRLGIGTTAPASIINASQSLNGTLAILLKNTSSVPGAAGVLEVDNDLGNLIQAGMTSSTYVGSAPTKSNQAFIQSQGTELIFKCVSGTGNLRSMLFSVGLSPTAEAMRIFSNGTLGINNATDSASGKLVVGGSALIGAGVTGATNGIMGINAGATGIAGTYYYMNAVLKAVFGITGVAAGLINGSAVNDFVIRNSQRIMFSADAGTTAHMAINANGAIVFPATNTATGTTGAQTINKSSGSVNVAAAGTTLVVTNSLVTTASLIFLQVYGTDATAKSATVTVAAGSFTITLNAAATAETKVAWHVIN